MFFKTMKSIENNFDDPQVNELLTKHFIELRSVSPEGSSHVLDIPGLKDPSIKFWSLWENNELIGCGALKLFDETHGEFKSIRVSDKWFKELESNDYVDKSTKKKINQETIRLLQIQKDTMIKQLMKIPKLYYAKSHFPLELSQRAFDHLWRVCESYELWCKETKQNGLILLNLTE